MSDNHKKSLTEKELESISGGNAQQYQDTSRERPNKIKQQRYSAHAFNTVSDFFHPVSPSEEK